MEENEVLKGLNKLNINIEQELNTLISYNIPKVIAINILMKAYALGIREIHNNNTKSMTWLGEENKKY